MKIGILFVSGIDADNDLSRGFEFFIKGKHAEFKELRVSDKNKSIVQPLSKRIEEIRKIIFSWKRSGLEVFVVGHSLGGALAVMAAKDADIDGLCLWDCSLDPKDIFKKMSFDNELNAYVFSMDKELRVSKEAFDELGSLQALCESFEYLKNRNIFFITAGKGGRKLSEEYHSILAPVQNRLAVLDQADHNFTSEEHKKDLFNLTTSFFNEKGPR